MQIKVEIIYANLIGQKYVNVIWFRKVMEIMILKAYEKTRTKTIIEHVL
jgi:hypothetical protein